MKAIKQYPHSPKLPILSAEEIEGLDIYRDRFIELFEARDEAIKNVAILRSKSESDAETVAMVRDGKIEENGKKLTNLSDEEIGARIQKAEGAAVSSRNRLRQAESDRRKPSGELLSLRQEFIWRWKEVFLALKTREEDVWNEFANEQFEQGWPIFRNSPELFKSTYVHAFIDEVIRHLDKLILFDIEKSAPEFLALIEKMKGSARP